MLRHLYRCAVRLHPSSFRYRFGDEMLSIFDQQKRTSARLSVMLDGLVSLVRQWTLRTHIAAELPVPAPSSSAHIPSFASFDAFRPNASAMIHGAVLSLILFCMTVVAIRYSWSHVLQLHIREIGTDWGQQVHPQARARNIAWLQLDPYVGEYVSKVPPKKISIRIEGDHLALGFAGHPSLALSPRTSERFMVDGVASNYVDFTSDAQGKICCLSVVIGTNVITAQRE